MLSDYLELYLLTDTHKTEKDVRYDDVNDKRIGKSFK